MLQSASMRLQPALPDTPVATTARAGYSVIAREAVPVQGIYLQRGRVAAGQLEDGTLRHRLLSVEGPCWLDVGTVLFKKPSAADWVAETDVDLLLVPGEALRKWFADLAPAVRTLVHDTVQLQRQQTDAALGLMVKDAEARCAHWLLSHAEVQDHGHVAVPMREPKRAIAAQLGIAPETLSRVLRRLRELGLISQTGSVMNLIDPGRLQALAGS
jgi:CRP-like cAMP-binding protein